MRYDDEFEWFHERPVDAEPKAGPTIWSRAEAIAIGPVFLGVAFFISIIAVAEWCMFGERQGFKMVSQLWVWLADIWHGRA